MHGFKAFGVYNHDTREYREFDTYSAARCYAETAAMNGFKLTLAGVPVDPSKMAVRLATFHNTMFMLG